MEKITQKRLKEVLDYDPETGVFVWLINRGSVKSGTICSCKQNGYIVIKIDGIRYYGQRLAWLYMTGKFPELEVDHINGKKNDNRWKNLREASRQQNRWNSNQNSKTNNPYKGVTLYKRLNVWQATIGYNGKRLFLGNFKTPEEAAVAYDIAAEKLFGDYALTNLGNNAVEEVTKIG